MDDTDLNDLFGDEDSVIENFIFHLKNALEVPDYVEAIKVINANYVDLYHEAGTHGSRMPGEQKKYIELFSSIFDVLLDFSDRLFGVSPMKQIDDWFRVEMGKCKEILDRANERAALEASQRLKYLLDDRQTRLRKLDEKGYYELKEFILFWRLWKLLDDILKHQDFPRASYDFFAAGLYGAIMPALLTKESVICFSRYYDEIFKGTLPDGWLETISSDDCNN